MTLPPLLIQYWVLKRPISPSRMLRKNDPVVNRMIASIKEYGFKIPILVSSEGEVIDGDLRLKAALTLDFVSWTSEQVRGFRLLANRSPLWAEWDLHAVAEELAELQTLHFDLSLTGFDPKEIEELLAPRADEETIDSVPETPPVPVSVPGDDGRSFEEIEQERAEEVKSAAA